MDEIDKVVEEEGFDSWVTLFENKSSPAGTNPDRPTIMAWKPIDEWGLAVQRWERNPYYWKIDTAGNQLPYLDDVQISIVLDPEAVLLKALAGEIDFQRDSLATAMNYPVVMQNREKGGYIVIPILSLGLSPTLWLNFFNEEDPVLNELFNNKDFRIALSISLDREEMNELVYLGQGKVKQMVEVPAMGWYDEERSKLYTEYDLDEANKILDGLGLEWDANHQYRVRSDGETLRILLNPIDMAPNDEVAELVKGYWAKIGIEVVNKTLAEDHWYATVRALTHQAIIHTGAGGSLEIGPLNSVWLFPIRWSSYWGGGWGIWYSTNGQQGYEPPAEVKKLNDLHEQLKATSSIEEYNSIMDEVMDLRMDNF